jgi:hypothetical protein
VAAAEAGKPGRGDNDGFLADAVAALVPQSGEWTAAPSEVLDGLGRGPGFPKNVVELVNWLGRSVALLAARCVEVGFISGGVGDLIVLSRAGTGEKKI